MLVAVLLWLAPRFRHRMTVRSFRKSLDRIDLVALSWSQGVGLGEPDDLRTTLPEDRRLRERRDEQPDDGGSLV